MISLHDLNCISDLLDERFLNALLTLKSRMDLPAKPKNKTNAANDSNGTTIRNKRQGDGNLLQSQHITMYHGKMLNANANFHCNNPRPLTTRTTQKKPYKYKCNECSYSTKHPSSLRIHERTLSGEKPFCCQICDKLFGRKDYLLKHMRCHTGEKPY
eukprot:372783_1